jgi:uncharacterized protein
VRRFQARGVIRHVGFSSHGTPDVVLAAIDTREFESVNLHYFFTYPVTRQAVERAAELDMGVFIISPTDKGGWLHRPTEKLRALAAPFSPMYLNDRWLLSQPAVHTISIGAAAVADFDEHVKAADVSPLTPDEKAALARIDAAMRSAGLFCTQCQACLPCPAQINIPQVLRLRNLTVGLDMRDFAMWRYGMFESGGHWFPGVRADKCTKCGDCAPRCPEKLPVPELMFETHSLLAGEKSKRLWG